MVDSIPIAVRLNYHRKINYVLVVVALFEPPRGPSHTRYCQLDCRAACGTREECAVVDIDYGNR